MANFSYSSFTAGLVNVQVTPGVQSVKDQMQVTFADGSSQTYDSLLEGLNTMGGQGWEFVGECHFSVGASQPLLLGILKKTQ